MSADDQVPEGSPTGDPDPFGEILNLGLPDATPPAAMPSAPLDRPPAPKSRRRSLIFGIIGVVVIIALGIGGFIVFSEASAAISAGSGTATITWTSAQDPRDLLGNPPQSFSGNINGHSLSGVATFSIGSLSTGQIAALESSAFHYEGSFAGEPFDIELSIHGQIPAGSVSNPAFIIKGTYGGQAVHAVLGEKANPNQSTSPLLFSGTVGKWRVTGSIHGPTGRGRERTATATFTVSG